MASIVAHRTKTDPADASSISDFLCWRKRLVSGLAYLYLPPTKREREREKEKGKQHTFTLRLFPGCISFFFLFFLFKSCRFQIAFWWAESDDLL